MSPPLEVGDELDQLDELDGPVRPRCGRERWLALFLAVASIALTALTTVALR